MLVHVFWRTVNPLVRQLAGFAPWWLLVETVGRKTGQTRRTPLSVGRRDEGGIWVIAVHGRHAGWVLNAEAAQTVRLRHRGRWEQATVRVHPWSPEQAATMSRYAQSGARFTSRDPLLVQLLPVRG